MKHYEYTKSEFMKETFIICNHCGYNNFKVRLKNFGTCLKCGKIIDEKSYFRKKLGGNLYGKKEKRAIRSSIKNL